ncbi:MAG: RIP metalloprotease RseP [Eubacteriales bacterium]|nr:RIP metalloprotease RseP [Eubacteriales bacterium]
MIETILLALLLFAVMIFPHELGHFIAAKSVGVQVNEFSFGMGPAVWKKERGETLYAVRIFPIGGYCAMEGEDEDSGSAGSRAFVNKKPWQKIYVLAAGAFMNVVICLLTLTIMAGVYGVPTTTLSEVTNGSPAYEAGIRSGDTILKVNGAEVHSWRQVTSALGSLDGSKKLTVTYQRDGKNETVSMKSEKIDGQYRIGISSRLSKKPGLVLLAGFQETGQMAGMIFQGLRMLISGGSSISDLSGPVGIVTVVHSTTRYGISYFFSLMALISVNLAVINLLPLPALDGGRILFVFVRWIARGKITDKQEGIVHFVGFVLLMLLTVIVTWNDIVRLIRG